MHDSITAGDFVVHVLSTQSPFDLYEWPILEQIMARFGVTNFFMGTIYCINRKLEINIYQGDYVACIEDQYNPKEGICGFGPSPLMAIVELHKEMLLEKVKSFIP